MGSLRSSTEEENTGNEAASIAISFGNFPPTHAKCRTGRAPRFVIIRRSPAAIPR